MILLFVRELYWKLYIKWAIWVIDNTHKYTDTTATNYETQNLEEMANKYHPLNTLNNTTPHPEHL